MKSWIWTSLVAMAVVTAAPGAVRAEPNANAALALHVGTRAAKNPCGVALPSRCEDFVTQTGATGILNIYLAVVDYDSTRIAGLQFGVQYDDVAGTGCDIDAWLSCGDMQFDSDAFPASGGGNSVTWDYLDNCQGDTTTYAPILAGVFEVTTYSGDIFRLIPRPVDGFAKVANCLYQETDITNSDPSRLGLVSFGMGPGYNPCLGPYTPVRATTWGNIKTLYEH